MYNARYAPCEMIKKNKRNFGEKEKKGRERSEILNAEKEHCHSVVKIIVFKKKKKWKQEGLSNVIVY